MPGKTLKVLGFHFGCNTSMRAQVDAIKRNFRQRLWTIFNLKKNGFTVDELVKVYITYIRSVTDYCDTVYHSLLTDELDLEVERLQDRALKCIYGWKINGQRTSGRRLRELAGVTTLRARRIEHCDTFVGRCLKNPRFAAWFPLKQGRRSARNQGEKYEEKFARCDRLRNSPVYFFRRRLNGKEGKTYGERYREYRE